MIPKQRIIFFINCFLFFALSTVHALELEQNGKMIIPDKTTETIKIDGNLNENVWGTPPLSEDFITYQPVYGEKLNQQTLVWMAYDLRNLYFAFKCLDEPDKIKTSITQRDKILGDDWVGVLLDAMGTKQTSYEFYVNPSGIQSDNLNSAVTGTDSAPDFVWESAGILTNEGYQIEIRIPLESIRFKSGQEVRMGVLLLRNISRLGVGATWPQTQPGQTDFNFMVPLVYKDLAYRLKLELLPNFTYSRDVERKNKDTWEKPFISKNVGASIKYGITSSITAEATVNPDFSQVESDAFQMEINQRYPIFHSEKRPFFMEGMDVFDFGIVNQGMMVESVDTRHINEPGWAAKLSGSLGRMNFALLTTNDKNPVQPSDDVVNSNLRKKATWAIFRGKYNLGSDNALGIIYQGRYFDGSQNNAIGVDFQFRFFENGRINAAYLYTGTKDAPGAPVSKGSGLNTLIQYYIPQFSAWATYERYDKNFNMASAFMNRIDISRGQFYTGPNFYLKIKGVDWFRRIQPHIQYVKLHDLSTHMDDTMWRFGADMYFSMSGFLRIEYHNEKEAWQGQLFDQKYFYSYGTVQLANWLTITGNYRSGDQLYYDQENPFLGTGYQIGFGFTFQPSIKLNLGFDMIHSELYRKADNKKFYSIDIFNAQTTYQFNKYFFIRAALRYDNYEDKLLTDLLASFTLIPGTVVHLGYGSLYENKEWQIDRWVSGQGHLINMKNGLFFKVSYLWQIK